MKYKLLIYGLVAILSLLTGCTQNELIEADKEIIATTNAMMEIAFDANAFKISDATLVLENISDVDICYDESISLHIENDGIWYVVPNKITDYPEVSYGISPGDKTTCAIDLYDHFGELDAGHYRIVKPIFCVGVEELVIAEFELTAE